MPRDGSETLGKYFMCMENYVMGIWLFERDNEIGRRTDDKLITVFIVSAPNMIASRNSNIS